MTRGFVLLAMEPNPKNTKWNVFYFNESPEINAAIYRLV
jgi:hypothetical protein